MVFECREDIAVLGLAEPLAFPGFDDVFLKQQLVTSKHCASFDDVNEATAAAATGFLKRAWLFRLQFLKSLLDEDSSFLLLRFVQAPEARFDFFHDGISTKIRAVSQRRE